MNRRPIFIFAGLLILGAAIYFYLSMDPNRIQEKQKFLSVDTSEVDLIRVVNKDGDLTLKKFGTTWKITSPMEYLANASYVKTTLEKVAGLEVESFITSNKEKYDQFEVGDSATYIEIGKEGGKVDKFYCGKNSPTWSHTYIRRVGSDEVWLISGSPRSSFSRKPVDWRDKRVLELDKTQLQRILISFEDTKIELSRQIGTQQMDSTLAKADTSWMASANGGAPFKPVERELNRVINTLIRINAIEFLDQGKDTIPALGVPDLKVEAFLEGSQHEVLEFWQSARGDGTRFFVRKNGDDKTIYLVYQSSAKNMMKSEDVLRNGEKDQPPADGSARKLPKKPPKPKGN